VRGCPQCGLTYAAVTSRCGIDGAPLVETRTHLLNDRKIGAYRIEAPLGAGGVGVVFRARHEVLGTNVAIKVLLGEMACRPVASERFHREAQAMSRIDHPNVVRTLDFGITPEGVAYHVMELIDGRSLSSVIADGPVPLVRVREIAADVARGLRAAHRHGYVHRDLKPGNIMLVHHEGREIAKVLDFGLVGHLEGRADPKLTQIGMIIGTPHYMAPETLSLHQTTPSSDLYSLGVTLFEMIAGHVPFPGKSVDEVFLAQLNQRPPKLPSAGDLSPLVDRLLAKQAKDRPSSADEVLALLESPERPDRTRLRAKVGAAMIALCCAGGAGLFWIGAAPAGDAPQERLQIARSSFLPAAAPEPAAPAPLIPSSPPRVRARTRVAHVRPRGQSPSASVAMEVRIESEPAGATVTLESRGLLGRTPLTAVLDGGRSASLLIEHDNGARKRVLWNPSTTLVRVDLK
jgi:eukaryotic-like serine/threonine-protein kinase